jgi:serine/threonine protein kinase
MELSQIDGQIFVADCPGLALGPHLKIGGQKSVWACAFKNQAYVLKAIMASDRALRRVAREIDIMQCCDSRYLPKFGPISLREVPAPTGERILYFLEEYIDGLPLASVRVPMVAEQVAALGRCVGEALRVLAARRYVHRDVKPMNIMQQTSSTYVLIDAGLALDLDGEALSLAGSAPVGTPAYFSPEQITLASRDLDPRSDLFSLGVTMYECATGEHPFLNDTLPRVNVFRNIVELAPPDPRELISTLPNSLCAAIGKLLQKDRNARYHNADELLADLA